MIHILLNIQKINFLRILLLSQKKLKEYKFDLENDNLKGKWILKVRSNVYDR